MDAKLAASWCFVNDPRPICFFNNEIKLPGLGSKGPDNGFLWLLPDCWDHALQVTVWRTDHKKKGFEQGLPCIGHRQELELDPSLGFCFCNCAEPCSVCSHETGTSLPEQKIWSQFHYPEKRYVLGHEVKSQEQEILPSVSVVMIIWILI